MFLKCGVRKTNTAHLDIKDTVVNVKSYDLIHTYMRNVYVFHYVNKEYYTSEIYSFLIGGNVVALYTIH